MRRSPIPFDADAGTGREEFPSSLPPLGIHPLAAADAACARYAGQLERRQLLNLLIASLAVHLAVAALFGRFSGSPLPQQPGRAIVVDLQQVEPKKEPDAPLTRPTPVRVSPAPRPVFPVRRAPGQGEPPPVPAAQPFRTAPRVAADVPPDPPSGHEFAKPAVHPPAPTTQPARLSPQSASKVTVLPSSSSVPSLQRHETRGDSSEEYRARIRALIEQRKEYPVTARKGRMEGVVSVRFVLIRSGTLRRVEVNRSSGKGVLDRAALQAVEAVGKFPPVPDDMNGEEIAFELPVRFQFGR